MPKRYTSSRGVGSITYWRKFAEHRLVYLLIAAVFAFGLVAYFGSGPMSGVAGRAAGAQASQIIATVNGEDIPRSAYDRQWDQMKTYLGSGNEVQAVSMQGMILNSLIDQAIMRAAAKKRGFTVSDEMVDKAIADMKKGPDGKPVPEADFEQMLQRQGLTLDDLRQQLKTDLLAKVLQDNIIQSQKVTEQDLLQQYQEARVRHILISTSKLPDEQARRKAEKIYEEIKAGKDFAALANQFSDDPSNKPQKWDPKLKKEVPAGPPKGGELGWAPLSRYVPEFADAIRKLKPGEVSPPVKTQFGYHIIQLEAPIRENLPKDFEKNKARLLEDLKRQKGQQALMKFMDEARKTAKIVWHDPSLQWRYDYARSNPNAMMMGGAIPTGNQEQLLQELRQYVAKNPDDGAADIILGQMLYPQYIVAPPGPQRDKLRDEIIKYYAAGLQRTEDPEVRMALAALYLDAKKPQEALKVYQTQQRLLRWDDTPASKPMHVRLERAFKDLGRPDLAAEEAKRIEQLTEQEKKSQAEAKARAAAEKAAKAPSGAQSPTSAAEGTTKQAAGAPSHAPATPEASKPGANAP
ncbi:MAG: peptidylprolyl isomerase [Chthonomonadales bacterium]